ncbi:MAG: MBL fold metallo-hydrolase [bacterium]|nr:MBL fold metallo-hydrolase [bacterium]
MVINWYGEGCFKVQTGGQTLLIDPDISSSGLTAPRGKVEATLRTLTPWPILPAEEEGRVVRGPGEYEVQGVEVGGFGLPKESTENFLKTVYLVKAEGLSLCFLGHMTDYPDADLYEELKPVDLLFIPAGGKPFLKQELAAKLIKQLEPKIIVASFFKVPGLKRSSDDVKSFAKELGLTAESDEKLVIKKKEVSEQKGIRLIALSI